MRTITLTLLVDEDGGTPGYYAVRTAEALFAAGVLTPGEGLKCPNNPTLIYTTDRTTTALEA